MSNSPSPFTYAVVGAGGVGALYGARLARAGCDVHFLLRSDYDAVKSSGLRIRSYEGDFAIAAPQIYRAVADMPKADVVIVGLKTTSIDHIDSLVVPLLKPNSLVLLIQNGIGVEEAVQAKLPQAQLVAGVAFVSSTKRGDGIIDHEQNGRITLAPYSCTDEAALAQLAADFSAAAVPVAQADYAMARWQKALWNLPFNGLSVVLQADCHVLSHSPVFQTLVRGLMAEVVAVAQADGCAALSAVHAERSLEATQRMLPYLPSMRVDFDSGRAMELEFFYATTLRIAARHGVATPLLAGLYAQLLCLEKAALPPAP